MDQFKEFLGLLRRQHFWFILPLVLIFAIAGWFLGSGKVKKEVKDNLQTISSMHQKVQQVSSVDEDGLGHPNEEWDAAMKEAIQQRLNNVMEAWKKKWDRQSSILVWPPDAFGPRSASVVKVVEKMRPIETADVENNRLGNVALNDYKNYVKQQLPKIAEKIGAIWDPEGLASNPASTRPGEGAAAQPAVDKPIVVHWNPENQKFLQQSFDWGNVFPTTLEVLYAQEDLWILNALADIIKTTNGDARTQATAPVKEIISIKYGKTVRRNGRVVRPAPPPSASSEDDEFQDLGTEVVESDAGTTTTEEGDSTNKKPPHLAAGRYVDENFQRIESVEELKSKLGIAKRIPVQIRVRVDQRYLNRLLAACANSPLTYEVHQLRINPPDEVSFSLDAFAIDTTPPPASSTSFSGDFGNFNNGQSAGSVLMPTDLDRLDRVIELWGIIYIFNPVDPNLLKGGSASEVDEFAVN